MITPDDFIRLPYTADLTRAGIAYACRSLAYTYDRMGGSDFDRLRCIVAGKAAELVFRRHLVAQGIPHDNLGATPFTDPDHYDVALGGRRCDLKSFLIFQKEKIRRLRAEPEYLMKASALVPYDQMLSGHLRESDIYIFAFITALITYRKADLERALRAGQPFYFIYPLPPAWRHPPVWATLGHVVLKSECQGTIFLELGGQGEKREFLSEEFRLSRGVRVEATNDYYSLAYLHVPSQPNGRVGVYCPGLRQSSVVHPHEWGNIWVYGMEVILAGYITRAEFRRRGVELPAGSQVLPYNRTRTKNQALLVAELHPLADLFDRAGEWGGKKHGK